MQQFVEEGTNSENSEAAAPARKPHKQGVTPNPSSLVRHHEETKRLLEKTESERRLEMLENLEKQFLF